MAFTFDLCGLLSVIRKQQLKQCNYSVDQSGLLTRFRTYFTSSVWNFCRWVADVPPRETSPAAKSDEKRMFSQSKEEEAVKRAIRQGVGDFRFINILQLLSIRNSCFYLFISSITLFYHLFLYFFVLTTFTHTHDPNPLKTTFSYTPPNVVWGTSQIWEVLLIGWIKFQIKTKQKCPKLPKNLPNVYFCCFTNLPDHVKRSQTF